MSTIQFKFFVIWLTESNLWEKEGTSRELDNGKTGDNIGICNTSVQWWRHLWKVNNIKRHAVAGSRINHPKASIYITMDVKESITIVTCIRKDKLPWEVSRGGVWDKYDWGNSPLIYSNLSLLEMDISTIWDQKV